MKNSKNLETSLVIVTGLVIFYLIKEWHILLVIATLIGLIGIFFNKISSGITWIWTKIADVLGAVVSKIILSVVFYLFLFPVALLSRIYHSDKLKIKTKKRETMWENRNHLYMPDNIRKSW